MITIGMKEVLKSGEIDALLMDIYLDETKLAYQRERFYCICD